MLMVDDIRPPRQKEQKALEEQNKHQIEQKIPAPALEAPHLYGEEHGFVSGTFHSGKSRFHLPRLVFKHATKKERVFGAIFIAMLIIVGGTGAYAINRSINKKNDNVATPIAQKIDAQPTTPTTEASKLTGVQVSPELNKRPVTGIMIENSPDARPQSGLKDAGIVYEAIAEGGITRFLTLFQESQPDYIGPVRSVRPYYVDLLLPFDASLAHAGGSGEGLAKVKAMGVKDLDHGANGSAFHRIAGRYAPHNLYTSMADLDRVSAARGYATSNVKSYPRKPEKAAAQVTARGINFTMSSPLYNVHYDYDQASNSYKRNEGGKPHTDQRSGQQLTPKTVVAMSMNYSQNGIYSVYQTTGSGKLFIFQDGVVQTGTWSRNNEKDQFEFKDDAGKQLPLNSGQTWITLVKNPGSVNYAP
jgi:hypothetical protein